MRAKALLFAGLMAWTNAADAQRPQRIVSMNLCTDQLLMRLVEPERIASISFLSFEPGETPAELQPILKQLRQNRGLAEQVLMLKPDLILAGQYSTLTTTPLLQKLGYKVVLFSPDNSFGDMRANIRKLGEAVGEQARAEKMIADFDRDLAALRAGLPSGPMPVYADIGVNNWMAGRGTLSTEVANAGGFRTLGETVGYDGYRSIPLEQLVRHAPDLISSSSGYANPPSMATQALGHPLIRDMIAKSQTIELASRYTTCANPSSLDAVRLLVEARKAVDAKKAAR